MNLPDFIQKTFGHECSIPSDIFKRKQPPLIDKVLTAYKSLMDNEWVVQVLIWIDFLSDFNDSSCENSSHRIIIHH